MVQVNTKSVKNGIESCMVSFDFTKTPITQIADYIIVAASKNKASDIHFDPREDGMMVRFRIDGDCQDYTYVPKAYEKNLATRLKILANMNITESRLPQDGAIKGLYGNQFLDMRVSSLPLNEGEKIVVRILDYSRSLEGVATLGFHPNNLEKIRRMMALPNGIILATGATGSGKSTTTYSILQELNKPETNIITVEDPIEMNIEGINQVQVNSEIGMTFATALRSILRQDPNIILIGEIRDSETAQIAVRASITGHLVLSTIHTNNALATVERLLDMDVERYLLSSALSGIISQRLAKKLCPKCHYQRETTQYEKKVFKKYMHMDVENIWEANPKGCPYCRRGYFGRIAIHEVLEINDEIRSAISNERVGKKDLAKMVYDGNTITMLQDALIKCLNGLTSFEEVYKNIEIENEDDDYYENNSIDSINSTNQEEVKKEEKIDEEKNKQKIQSSPTKHSKTDEPQNKNTETESVPIEHLLQEEEEKEKEINESKEETTPIEHLENTSKQESNLLSIFNENTSNKEEEKAIEQLESNKEEKREETNTNYTPSTILSTPKIDSNHSEVQNPMADQNNTEVKIPNVSIPSTSEITTLINQNSQGQTIIPIQNSTIGQNNTGIQIPNASIPSTSETTTPINQNSLGQTIIPVQNSTIGQNNTGVKIPNASIPTTSETTTPINQNSLGQTIIPIQNSMNGQNSIGTQTLNTTAITSLFPMNQINYGQAYIPTSQNTQNNSQIKVQANPYPYTETAIQK